MARAALPSGSICIFALTASESLAGCAGAACARTILGRVPRSRQFIGTFLPNRSVRGTEHGAACWSQSG